jgi:DNA oxidative demethylase
MGGDMSVRKSIRAVAAPPRGFVYRPEFLAPDEERMLLGEIARLDFEPVRLHGVEARRQVVHFGARYAYDGGTLSPAAPLPAFLHTLSVRAAAAARFPADAAVEALVTRYPPGAGIGWHRDAPPFGPAVAGVSLGGACDLRLRETTAEGYEVYRLALAPRSLYVLSGTARYRWQHAIRPVPQLRYSVTFRTVRV